MFLGVDKATRLQTAFLKKCSDKYFMECFEENKFSGEKIKECNKWRV